MPLASIETKGMLIVPYLTKQLGMDKATVLIYTSGTSYSVQSEYNHVHLVSRYCAAYSFAIGLPTLITFWARISRAGFDSCKFPLVRLSINSTIAK